MHVGRQPNAAWGKRERETMARIPPVKGCGLESAGVRPVKVLSPLPSSVVAGPGAEKEAGGVCVCVSWWEDVSTCGGRKKEASGK